MAMYRGRIGGILDVYIDGTTEQGDLYFASPSHSLQAEQSPAQGNEGAAEPILGRASGIVRIATSLATIPDRFVHVVHSECT